MFVKEWSSLVEGDEGIHLPICRTYMVIVVQEMLALSM